MRPAAGVAQVGEVAALVAAAQDREHGPSKASRLFRAASTLVALESLKKRDAADLGHALEHVLDAAEARPRPGRWRRRGAPSSRAAAAAASRSPARCAPGSRTEARVKSVSVRPSRRSRASPSSKYATRPLSPRAADADAAIRAALNRHEPRLRAAGQRKHARRRRRSPPPSRRPVWFAKMRALASRVVLEAGVAVEVVGREVQEHRDLGWNVSVPSSWKLETSSRRPSPCVGALEQAVSGLADVAADPHVLARLAQHRAQGGGGGGLALGARDGRHRARDVPVGRAPARRSPARRRAAPPPAPAVPGHARETPRPARRPVKVRRRCPPSSRRTPCSLEAQGLRLELPRRLPVGGHDARPAPREEARRRDPRPRQTDDHDGFPLQLHGDLHTVLASRGRSSSTSASAW